MWIDFLQSANLADGWRIGGAVAAIDPRPPLIEIAYDNVNWQFLMYMLERMGLGHCGGNGFSFAYRRFGCLS
ncbi:hypothetical protein CsSME_00026349 [Camellia sinensis var. sinensis]